MHILTGLLISALLGRMNRPGNGPGNNTVLSFPGVVEVRHILPGRVRLFFPSLVGNETAATTLQRIKQAEALHSMESDVRTGTVVLRFDPARVDAEILVGACIRLLGLDDEIERIPVSTAGRRIGDALDALDRAVLQQTHGVLDFKTATALGLVAFGTYRAATFGLGTPGAFTLFWWAGMMLVCGGRKDVQ